MSILLVAVIVVLIAITTALTLRERRPDPAAVLLSLLALTACAGFMGFLLSDVRASYLGASIDRTIEETHLHLTSGHSDAVTHAYEQAKQHRDSGASPHNALATLVRTLRAIPDATGDE